MEEEKHNMGERMKSDELSGGLKIFHGDEENFEKSHETHWIRRISQTHNKLPSLVDLVMWRDVSKSAFVFGIGTFIIIASSYTKDINIRSCHYNEVGNHAACFDEVWQHHNYLEDGQIGVFWSILLTKDMLIPFHAHHCLR
ncbi:Reticulon-like protein B21 [Camellia lanceoleosa]|uniref:Reticulon-like protein B21 n=1 Tax=Camellia lanceoleosa TaxID=1840588 RepID=A0ACC0IC74_9ERIC|nr:Reticulon-like protein B21 [Camellia lanceoleosa]